MKSVVAVYENGVFRPVSPVDLPEHTTVLVPLEGGAVASGSEASGEDPLALRDPWPANAPSGAELTELLERSGPVTCYPKDAVAWQRQMRDEEWPDPVFPKAWLTRGDDVQSQATKADADEGSR